MTRNDPTTGETIKPCLCCGHTPLHASDRNADGLCLGCEQSGESAPASDTVEEFGPGDVGEWAGWITEAPDGTPQYSRIHLWTDDAAACGAAPRLGFEWIAEHDGPGGRCARCERAAR